MFKKPLFSFGAALALSLLSPPLWAGELEGGRLFFDNPPLFQGAATTFSGVSVPAAKYYFTFSLPANAGAPIGQIQFQQQPNPDPIDFVAERTAAFLGAQNNLGAPLTIQSSVWDSQTGLFTVTFDPPIPPGADFVVRLQPVSNPDISGVYQFRVTVSPPGAGSLGLDLGVARLQFYREVW
ncbi:MAG: DUF2808 domain-containing protein [Cyanobacteria bacterium RI_101]|nr:DUF2808 domain-containing protein [Cyanobacteria bacterium RI_101]